MREAILGIIERKGPIKAVNLALDCMGICNPVKFNYENYSDIIEELVRENEIIELEYTDPETPYRVKSLYFKKGTQIMTVKESHEQRLEDVVDRYSPLNSELPYTKT